MEIRARLESMLWDSRKKKAVMTFSSDSFPEELEGMEGDLRLTVEKWRNKRSKDANAMLWACIGSMANNMHVDKWDVYLHLLRRYGSFTYIVVKADAVEAVRRQWRETEVVGESDLGGQKAVQLLCYYGSHTYDAAEFSRLLDGAISEMQEMGLTPPPSEDMRRALEKWDAEHSPGR